MAPRVEDIFRTLLPREVVVVVATPEMWSEQLHPVEERYVRGAVTKRIREFAAGRACARRALAALGFDNFPLQVVGDRSPLWPAGVLGSITHTDQFCAAAVCRRGTIKGFGIDAERAVPLPEDMIPIVCTPNESASLMGFGRPGLWAKLVFSAKESIYKSYFPETRTFLDFHDVEVSLNRDENRFVGVLNNDGVPSLCGRRSFFGSYATSYDILFTVVTVE
jgi:4'-phosphopantetheinyl transferase EntD